MPINEYEDLLAQLYPTVGKNQVDEYDRLAGEIFDPQKPALQNSMFRAVATDPDTRARAMKIADQAKLPIEYVERNFDKLSRDVQVQETDYDRLITESPKLAKWLENPDNMAVARDDIDNLHKIEKGTNLFVSKNDLPSLTKFPGELTQAFRGGYNDLEASAHLLGLAYGLGDDESNYQAVANAVKKSQEIKAREPEYAKEFTAMWEKEGGDVNRAFQGFAQTYDAIKQKDIKRALLEFHNAEGMRTVGETLDLIASSVIRPRGLLHSVAQNLAQSLPSLTLGTAGGYALGQIGTGVGAGLGAITGPGAAVSGAAGGAIGGTVGFVGGSFLGSVPVEIGSTLLESLQKRGYDLTNPSEVKRAFSDPKVRQEVIAESERKGLTTAAVDAVFNAFAGRALKAAKPQIASKVAAGALDTGVQAVGETVSEAAGQVARDKGDLTKLDLGSAIAEGIASLGHSAAETGVGSSYRKAFSKDTLNAATELQEKTQEAIESSHSLQALSEVGAAIKESKLAGRSTEKLQDLVAGVTDGASVYFQSAEWDRYWQSQGASPAKAAEQILGDGGKAYTESKEIGGVLKIPMSSYISQIARTEHFDGLMNIVRTSVDGMNAQEAMDHMKGLSATLKELADEVAQMESGQAKEKSEHQQIIDDIRQKLEAAGRSKTESETLARMYAERYQARAQRLDTGKTALQLYQQDGPRIQQMVREQALGAMEQAGDYKHIPVEFDEDNGNFEITTASGTLTGQILGPSYENELSADGSESPSSKKLKKVAAKYSKVWKLDTLEIKSDAQKKGRGAQMLDSMIREAHNQGADAIVLNASPMGDGGLSLDDLIEFYGSRGFKVLDRYENQNATMLLDMKKAPKALKSFFQSPIDIAPAFYSKLERLIEQKMGNSATIDQVRALMKDIKEEERKWSGIDEFLKGKTKVSKSEMLDFLRGNQLEIKEVVKGGEENFATGYDTAYNSETGLVYVVSDDNGEVVADGFATDDEALRWIQEKLKKNSDATKFSQYTLPGGENYREVLFTLPPKENDSDLQFSELSKEWHEILSKYDQDEKVSPEDQKRLDEISKEQQKLTDGARDDSYHSSHWDESNVLAHVRLNDRTDADGKKVLFVEEIQSDWHQEGRKKGYRGDEPDKRQEYLDALEKAEAEYENYNKELLEKYLPKTLTLADFKEKETNTYSYGIKGTEYSSPFGDRWAGGEIRIHKSGRKPKLRFLVMGLGIENYAEFSTEEEALAKALEIYRSNIRSARSLPESIGINDEELVKISDLLGKLKRLQKQDTPGTLVPDAPFKKTWHEFALKRIIRMAAEGGYDAISWTTGEQQAERYDLSKQISTIWVNDNSVNKHPTGGSTGFYLTANDLNGHTVIDRWVESKEKLADYIGKEAADKIFEHPSENEGLFKLSGLDLKIGGEGMKGFYDKIVPDFLNKFGKKYGAKVGEAAIEAGKASHAWELRFTTDEGKEVTHEFNTKEDAEQWVEGVKSTAKGFINNPTITSTVQKTPVHTLPLTPELKKAALEEGFSLFQDSEGGPRGRIQFGNLNALIELGQTADASTFIHETGHLWLNEMAHDIATLMAIPEAERTEKQKKLIDDGNTILEWLGVDSWEAIGREQHEQWARGFEAYTMEGKSPSEKLRKAFARFRVWLTSIYKSIANLGVILTPEIRGVMDRMVATEEQIAQAETQVEPLFEDPWKFGFTGEKAEAYIRARNDAKQAAEEELNRKLMKEYLRAQTEWWKDEREKVRAQFEAQVNAEPIQRVISILQKNTNPDGTPTNAQPIKLSKDALVQMFGKDILKKLPRGVMDAKDGLHPDIVASMLGYESGAVMVDQMSKAPNRVQEIERLTDEKMRELHPDLLNSTTLPEEAIKAVHNEERSTLLKMELEHLASNDIGVLKNVIKKVSRVVPTDKSIKDQAKKTIGAKKVTDLSPRIYQTAEAKAAKEAGELLAKGDLDGAFQAKQRQWLAHEMYRAAIEAQESMDKFMELAKKIARKDADLSKSRDIDLVNAARAILAAHSIGKTDKTAAEFLEPIRRYDPDTYETVAALVLSVTKNPMPYQELSFDDFTAMKEAVESIWELSRTNRQMEIDGQKRDRNDVKMELQSRVVELSSGERRKGYDKKVSEWDKAIIGFMGVRAALRRVESWVDAMDGGDASGVFRKYIWNPISEAVTEYRTQKKVHIRKYKQIIEAHEFDPKPILSPELGYTFDGKAELLGAMLHTGNESNFQKLLRGRGWGILDIDGNLDRSKWDTFVARLQKEGVLTKEDYDFLQSIWDLNEELKPLAQKAHKQMYGYYFNEVTADELKTPYGNYRGGYVPAIADSYMATDQAAREEKEALEKSNNSFMFPTAGRGFTKSRVEGYAAPLVIDIRRIPSHIDKLLRFVYIEPRVKEVSRMLWDKEFRKAMDDFDSTVVSDMLIPWLQRSAQQMVSVPATGNAGKAGDRFFKYLRRTVGLQAMFANVTNTLQQFTGITIAGLKVSPKYLNGALWTYTRNPTETVEKIVEKSKFMATRMTPQAAELVQQADEILLNPTKAEVARDWAIQHGYFLQSMAQNVVDTITWMGAYNEAVENGADEKSAVRQADSAVRLTQGSMSPEDISRYEAGPSLARLFTMFYSYFNMQANLLGTEFLKVHRDMGLKKGAGKALYIYTLGFMLPAVISEMIVKAMSGKFDEDDDDEYIDDFFGAFFSSQFRSAAALIPIGGQVATASINAFNDKWYDDRISTSPAVAMIESAASAPHSVYEAVFDRGNKKKAIRDSLTLLGLLSGVPMTALAKPAGYLSDVADRKARPTGPIDFTRGLITGKSGK